MTQAKGQKASLYAEYLPNYPKPPEKQNVHALLQGQRVANSGANQNLANLLNPENETMEIPAGKMGRVIGDELPHGHKYDSLVAANNGCLYAAPLHSGVVWRPPRRARTCTAKTGGK